MKELWDLFVKGLPRALAGVGVFFSGVGYALLLGIYPKIVFPITLVFIFIVASIYLGAEVDE
jgi:hypothetical protein